MNIDDVKSVVAAWRTKDLSAIGIKFEETYNPYDPTPYPDYKVDYECSFEPINLEKARVEFWVAGESVAVGIEYYDRILKRTGLWATRTGFAAGLEPHTISKEALQILFDAVTQGRIFIVVKSLFKVVTSVKLYMRASDYEAMVMVGYGPNWFRQISDDTRYPSVWWGKVLRYQPW
jgi:hypothetical protein